MEEIFEILKRKSGSEYENMLYIDDQSKNTDVGTNLGMKTILYSNYDDLVEEINKYLAL